jgi:hypothetical protein
VDSRNLFNPTFLIAAGTLALGSAFVYGWIAAYGLYPIKEPVPLQAYLDSFPDEIVVGDRTYLRVRTIDLSKDILDFLFDGGMGEQEDYMQWYLVPESEAREILKRKQQKVEAIAEYRRRMPGFAAANLDDPMILRAECDATQHPELLSATHLVSLFITYYTGKADTVPHVPERCYLGAGNKLVGEKVVEVPCPEGIQWGERTDFPIKILDFEKAEHEEGVTRTDRTTVAYYFVANWKYMDQVSRLDVRLTLADPTKPRVFFSKVEATFNNLSQPRTDELGFTVQPDRAELESNLRAFLQVVAPMYEESFLPPPSQQSAEAGPRPEDR